MSIDLFEEVEEEREAFVVDTDVKAEWAIRKIADNDRNMKEEIARLEEQMKWYKEEIEKVKAEHDRSNDYFSGLLESYFQTKPHKVTKTGIEKYKLPHAELVLKPQDPEYCVEDSEALVGWLSGNKMDQFIKAQAPKPDWAGLKKMCEVVESSVEDPITGEVVTGFAVAFKDSGELVHGVSVVPREPKFVVDIKEGAL